MLTEHVWVSDRTSQTLADLKPVWLMDPKEVDSDTHEDFYRHVSGAFDKPRFVHHFRADAPMDIRALLYVPESRPGMFETRSSHQPTFSLFQNHL